MNIPNNNGETPVYMATQFGHSGAVTTLIAAGANVNTSDNDGVMPVWVAAQNGDAGIITALTSSGADVNRPRNDGVTPAGEEWMFRCFEEAKEMLPAIGSIRIGICR